MRDSRWIHGNGVLETQKNEHKISTWVYAKMSVVGYVLHERS